MDRPLSKLVVGIAVIAVGVAAIFVVSMPKSKPPIIPAFASVISTPSPTPSATNTVLAPNGLMTLTVKNEKTASGVNYTISATNKDSSPIQIYSKTEPTGSSLLVPDNTFSPDNKYIFLKETTPTQTYYYALSTDGKPLTKDSQAIEITSLFYAKYTDFKITDMTGWGGITLIVINTNNSDGKIGPSFWFEVPTQAFIRLSNRFN